MKVAVISCPECGDEWHVPEPDVVRNICRVCGSTAEVQFEVVT